MKAFSLLVLSAGVTARSIPSRTVPLEGRQEENRLVARQWSQQRPQQQPPQQSGWYQYTSMAQVMQTDQQQRQQQQQPQYPRPFPDQSYSPFTPVLLPQPQPTQQGGWSNSNAALQPIPNNPKIPAPSPSASASPAASSAAASAGILGTIATGAIGLVTSPVWLPLTVVSGLGSAASGLGNWLFNSNGTSVAVATSSPLPNSAGGWGQPQQPQGGWNQQQPQLQPLPQSNNGWGQPPIQQGGWGSPQPIPTPSPTPTGGWFSSLFGGSKVASSASPSASPSTSPSSTLAPNYANLGQGAAPDADEDSNSPMVPRYIQCAGNTSDGACPYQHVCLGDPRSRGVVLDSICVPTQMTCGGKHFDLCPSNMICVSDPRTPSCQPSKGDVCAGLCV